MMSPVRGLLFVVALSVCLRSVPAEFLCAQWEQLGTLSGAMNFPALSGFSPSQFGMYRLSNAAGTNHLYIRDDSPAFFNANWPAVSTKHTWVSQTNNVACSVDGRTFVGAPAGTFNPNGNAGCNDLVSWMSARSPPAHVIGDHVCGTGNGWMLVHAGTTYDYAGAPHPCPMPGVTFTKLAACRDGVDVSTDSVVDLTVADLEVLLSRAGGPTLISKLDGVVAKIDTLETNWSASFVCETKATSSAVERWCSLRRM